jgi:uncharacterized protein
MIHQFSFKNFRSFAGKAAISFMVGQKGFDSNMYFNSPAGIKLNKVGVIIGHNAAGKTNVIRALTFLAWFVCNSFYQLKGEESIPINGFFSDNSNDISEFEVIFEYKNVIYRYTLHLCNTHVILEKLQWKDKTNHFKYLFKRIWNGVRQDFDINSAKVINLNNEIARKILRKNVSLIAVGAAISNNFLTDFSSYWQTIVSNLDYKGSKESDLLSGIVNIAEKYHYDASSFERVKQFLKDIDLGLTDLFLMPYNSQDFLPGKNKEFYIPMGTHVVGKKAYHLPIFQESDGTKNMFVLFDRLFPVLENGGIAAIDELEIDVHPHVLPRIIELFINPVTNPNNCQLIFTSHSLEILNYLQKEQVFLVEKDQECKSELYRLDEVKGVRRDDNLYAKYMAGAYGAIPNI